MFKPRGNSLAGKIFCSFAMAFIFLMTAGVSRAQVTNTNTVTNGGVITNGNTEVITNPVTQITGAITNDGSLQFWQTDGLSNAFAISGAGEVSQLGSGTTMLLASNSFGGTTTVNAGALVISGPGSISNTNNIFVGFVGSGALMVVSNGGQVRGSALYIGYAPGDSSNTVIVDGSSSALILTDALVVGVDSNQANSLIVTNGASVTTGLLFIGSQTATTPSSSNTLVISGSNSVVTATNFLVLGDSSSGDRITVSSGGRLNSLAGARIGTTISGTNAGLDNTVLVTGAGSLWSNAGSLLIGDTGSGTVTLSRGGALVSGTITLGLQSNSEGMLNIGGLGSNEAAGSISAPSIAFGSGTGTINFNQSNLITVAAAISGSNGSVNQLGVGTTILTGNNDFFSGQTVITNGTLQIGTNGTNGSLGYGAVNISGSGNLAFDLSSTVTSQNLISGAGSLSQIGGGTLILLGSNGYGETFISTGTLQVGNGNNIGSLGTGSVTMTNNATLAINLNSILTLSNVITGAGSFAQLGSGTTILNGRNDYVGTTFINQGTLQIGNGSTNGTLGTGSVTLSSPGVNLIFNRSDSFTLTNRISGAGNVSQFGTGTVTFSGSNSFTGINTVENGTLVLAGSLAGGSGRFYVGNTNGGATLILTNGGVTVLDNLSLGLTAASSNNTLLVNGATLNLANTLSIGADTNTGSSRNTLVITNGGTVSSGNLFVGFAGGTGAGSNAVIITGGASTLTSDGSRGLGNFIGYNSSGNNLTVSNGAAFTTLGQTYIGAVGGSNNTVLITGVGSAWYGAGINVGGGSVAGVGAGSLTVAEGALLQASNGLTLASLAGSVGTLNFGAFGSNGLGGALTNTPTITFGAGSATLNFNQSNSVTVAAALSGSNGTVNQLGGGTTILTGNNSGYTSLINVANGTLAVGTGGSLGTSNTISNNASLLFSSAGIVTVSGTISGGGSLTQAGSGTTILSGNNAYTGNTLITSGTIRITSTNSLGAGSSTLTFNGSGATLQFGSSFDSGRTMVFTTAGIIDTAGNSNTLTGSLSGGGGLIVTNSTGTGTLTLAQAFPSQSIGAGTLTVASGATLQFYGTLSNNIVNNGTLYWNNRGFSNSGLLSGTIEGTGSLVSAGTNAGTNSGDYLTLVSSNSYSGGTLIKSGTYVAGQVAGAFGSGTVTVQDGGTFWISASQTNALVISGTGGADPFVVGAIRFAGTNVVISGPILLTGNSSIESAYSVTNSITGNVNLSGYALSVNMNAATEATVVSGSISNGGSLQITGGSGGRVILTGSNSYGSSVINAGNILQIGTNGTTGSLGVGGVNNSGSIVFSRSDLMSVSNLINGTGSLTQDGSGTLQLLANNGYAGTTLVSRGVLMVGNGGTSGSIGTNAVTVSTNATLAFNRSDSITIGNVISGAGSLLQSGIGTLTLIGSNSYSGATTVNAGRLILNGTNTGGGTIAVNSGTLAGTGSATNSAVNVGAATIAPGNGSLPGTLSIGSLILNTGSTLNILLGGNSTSLLAVNGAATLGGALSFSTNAVLTASSYTFLTSTGLRSGSFTTTNSLPTGYQIVYTTNSVILQAVAQLGPITATFGGTNAVITGGSTNFLAGVTNTALAGSANLVFTVTNGSNTTGSIGSTTLTPQSGTNVNGLVFIGTNVGSNQTGTFTVIASNAIPASGMGTVTVNVFDHAAGALLTNSIGLSNVIVDYTGTVSTNVGLTNSNGFRVALAAINISGTNSSLGMSGASSLTSGSSTNLILTFASGQGTGTYSNNVILTYGDASTLNGASTNVGSSTLTVTQSVFDHAAGALATNSIALSNVIVGYAGTVTTNVGLTNSNGFRVALAATNISGTNSSIGMSGASSLTAGSSTNLTLTFATGQGTGTYSNNVTLTYADASTLSGASTNLGSQTVTVTQNVYDHALGVLGSSNISFSNVIVGYTNTQSTNIGVSNASGFRVGLYTTNTSNGTVSLSGATNVVAGASFNALLTFGTGQGTGTFTNTLNVVYGDSTNLVGATATAGTNTLAVSGAVYDHAAGALATNSIALSNVIVGYAGTVTTNVGLTNSNGFRVALAATNIAGTNASLGMSGEGSLTAGSSTNLVLTFGSGQGTGTYSNNVTLTYADASTLSGASTNLGSQTVTVTQNVYDHALGSLAVTNVTLADVILGYAIPLTTNIGISNVNGFRVALGVAAVTSSNSLSLSGVTNVAQGTSSNALLSFATGQGTGTFTNQISVIYADSSVLSGATNNAGSQTLTVSGAVYGHAAGAISGTNVIGFSDVIVGYTGTGVVTNTLVVTNSNGFRVNLRTTGVTNAGGILINNLSGITPEATGSISATLTNGLSTGAVSQNFIVTYADDSSLAGASTNLGSQTVTVAGNVYAHASGSLSTTNVALRAVHVGYTNTQTNAIGVSNAIGFRVSLALADAPSSNGVSLTGVTNVVQGTSSNAVLTFATNQGVGVFTNLITVVYSDASSLPGASTNVGTSTLMVTGYVYSGQGTWTGGSGDWTNIVNWSVPGGTPGLDGALSTNDSATFGSGSGGVVTLNTNAALNALTFSNASAYTLGGSGTISMVQGTLSPSVSTLAGSHVIGSALNLTTNTAFTGVSGSQLTMNGVISGAGGATFAGAATFALTQNNTYSGGTLITGTSKVVTSSGGALGTGAVILSGGSLEIRSQILNVDSFTWTGGQIALPQAGSSVYLNIANAFGTTGTNVFNLSGANLAVGIPTRLLAATNSTIPATNNFSAVLDPGATGQFLISNNILWFTLLTEPTPPPPPVPDYPDYTEYAVTPNQYQVATALNAWAAANPTGDQAVVLRTIGDLTNSPSQMQSAFEQIMPTIYQSLGTIAFNLANAQNNDLVERLFGQRVASVGGFSMSGFADNTPMIEGQGDGKGVLDAKKDILRPAPDNRWTLFLDGNGIFAQATSGNMLPKYNAQSGGITTGVGFRVTPTLSVGAYAGYEGSYVKYNGGSRVIDNSVRFGIFGTYGAQDGRGFYVDALVGGGYNNYQITRNISFPGLNRTANSTPGAGELDSMLALGYNIRRGNWNFGPVSSLQYTYLGMNPFNETGAQSLNLSNQGWSASSLLYSLGANAAYAWHATRNLMVVPQINLSWQHEFLQNPYAINSLMGGAAFANWSATPLRDFLYTGIGVTLEYRQLWYSSFFYNAAAGNADLQSQNIFWSAGVKF